MIKDSQPTIQNNLFRMNMGIGLYIKDKSRGKIQMNRVSVFSLVKLLVPKQPHRDARRAALGRAGGDQAA
jgi:parallel beta-helix repeat protein